MKTPHARFFAGKIQGKPAGCRLRDFWRAALVLSALLAACWWCGSAPPALADGDATAPRYGPPPPLPAPAGEEDDASRRDFRMGTVDNMRLGRDAEGNVVMEIKAPAKKAEEQPPAGPFFIYPQVEVAPVTPGSTGRPSPGPANPGGGIKPGSPGDGRSRTGNGPSTGR